MSQYTPKYLREDDREFKNLTVRTTENGWIEFKKEAKINPNTFFKDYGNSLGLGQHYDFKPLKDETDNNKIRHQRFQLHYKNIPVEGAEFSLHSAENALNVAHGRVIDGLDIDISKPMDERAALIYALADKKLTPDDFTNKDLPQGTLVLTKKQGAYSKENYRLAYWFNVVGKGLLDAHKIYVDAQTGEIINRISLVHQCFRHNHLDSDGSNTPNINTFEPPAPLVASTFTPRFDNRYGNPQNFDTETDPNNPSQFRLSSNNGNLITRNAIAFLQGNILNFFNAQPDVVNPNTNWGANNQNAATAHWINRRMYDFLNASPFNRNGMDGNGFIGRVLVNAMFADQNGNPANVPVAFWAVQPNNVMAIGFGRTNGVLDQNRPLTTIDIVGHELTHGYTDHMAGLVYQGESGALNESISDIFGTALERNILPNNWNWTLGEDAMLVRNMANPAASADGAQPDRYFGSHWYSINPPCNDLNDFCGVHTNSGVMNKWFHTLCTGQNPHSGNVQAIDFGNATRIVFRALQYYLHTTSNYLDAREATLMAAQDLFGGCSNEAQQVVNAWVAADVGANYTLECPISGVITPGCYRLRAQHSNKYVQIPNNTVNAQLIQNSASGGNNQVFKFESANPLGPGGNACQGCFKIINQENFKFVKFNGSFPQAGSQVIQDFWRTDQTTRYGWRVISSGDGTFQVAPSSDNNYRFDVSGVSTSDGAGIHLWATHGGGNQKFFFEPATCPNNTQSCSFVVAASASDTNPSCNASITLSATCSGDCSNMAYTWTGNGLASNSPSVTVSFSQAGTFNYTLNAFKNNTVCSGQTIVIPVTVYGPCNGSGTTCPNTGSISYQRWENIGGGTSIQDLRNNTNNLNNGPSHTQTLNSFEAPLNILDNYGVRIRGYICPPTTGNYTFWVAGDDNSELWISPNDQPANMSRIAYHTNWTPSLEWNWFGTQQSAPITLQAGQRYYVEALMKEGSGGDNLAVGWQLPNGALERPIPGNRLIPFDGGSGGNCNFSVSPSSSNPNPSCGASITLNANCSGSDCGSVNYSWSGNGLSGSNSSVTTNVPSSNGTFTYTVTASKSGCNNQSGNVNVTVSGCGGTLNQCIEAESSSGTGAITSDPNASNGETRGEENNYSHYVDYVVTNVPSASTYYVTLRYYSSSAPAIGVQVNGSGGGNFSLPHSGSWNIVWTEYTFTVSLGAGTNTIRIQGTGGGSCRQDRICVSSNPPRIGVAGEKEAVSEESQTLQLYPNPTDGKVTVRYYLEKGQKASLQFINASGQVLIQKGLVGEGGWGQSQTDLSAQPEGSYVVRMETQEKTVSRKFVIVK